MYKREELYAVVFSTGTKSPFSGSSCDILMCFNNKPAESQTYLPSVKPIKLHV